MVAWRSKSCRLSGMLALTVSFFLVELISGYMTNSMSLVADSFHMLSDVLALSIAFFSVRIAKKRSKKNTFGWARAEVLGALINSVFLFALCFSILIEAVKRLIEVEEVHDPLQILIVGGLGLLVNLLGLALFHGHAHEHHVHPIRMGEGHNLEKLALEMDLEAGEEVLTLNASDMTGTEFSEKIVTSSDEAQQQRQRILSKHADEVSAKADDHHDHSGGKKAHAHSHAHGHSHANLNMRAAFLHVLGDALGSVVVIISALVILFTDWGIKDYVDPIMSMILVTIILWTTGPVIKESALVLLQTVPTHIKIDDLKVKLVKLFPEISSVHEFHVWQLTGNKIIASAHIRCRSIADYMLLAKRIKKFFHNEGIHSTTIQPEFVEQPSIALPKMSICMPADAGDDADTSIVRLVPNRLNQSSDESTAAVDGNELPAMPSGNPIAGFREAVCGDTTFDDDEEGELLDRTGCVLQCPADDQYECRKDRCCDTPRERLQMVVTTSAAPNAGPTTTKRSGIFNLFAPTSSSHNLPVATVPNTSNNVSSSVDSVNSGTTAPSTSNQGSSSLSTVRE